MISSENYKKNKNIIGFVLMPLIPISIYIIDSALLGYSMSQYIYEIYLTLGVASEERLNNFYNFDYGRVIIFFTLFLSPIFILHWFYCANPDKFNFSGKSIDRVLVALFPFLFLAIWLLILFMPVSLSEVPSKKQMALYRLHRNPALFTMFLYSALYLAFMVFGLCLRYLWSYLRKSKDD